MVTLASSLNPGLTPILGPDAAIPHNPPLAAAQADAPPAPPPTEAPPPPTTEAPPPPTTEPLPPTTESLDLTEEPVTSVMPRETTETPSRIRRIPFNSTVFVDNLLARLQDEVNIFSCHYQGSHD